MHHLKRFRPPFESKISCVALWQDEYFRNLICFKGFSLIFMWKESRKLTHFLWDQGHGHPTFTVCRKRYYKLTNTSVEKNLVRSTSSTWSARSRFFYAPGYRALTEDTYSKYLVFNHECSILWPTGFWDKTMEMPIINQSYLDNYPTLCDKLYIAGKHKTLLDLARPLWWIMG